MNYEQWPEKFSHEDYENARKTIIEQYQDVKGLVSIYETGTVADPGISDLDIKFVYTPDGPVESADQASTSNIVNKLVGRGNIISIPTNFFKKINCYNPTIEPVRLYGEELSFDQLPESEHRFRAAASIGNHLPERLYRIIKLQKHDTIPVMRALQVLKSIGYSTEILSGLHDDFDDNGYFHSVHSLRGEWFDRSREKNIRLLHQHIDQAQEVLENACQTWYNSRPPDIVSGNSDESGAISLIDDLVYVSGDRFEYREGEEFDVKITLPAEWFEHYRYYVIQDTFLSQALNIGYVGSGTSIDALTEGFRSYLDKKLFICDKTFRWSVENSMDTAQKFGYLLHRMDWDEKQEQELRNRLQQVLD